MVFFFCLLSSVCWILFGRSVAMHSKELWPFIFLLGLLFFNYPILDLVEVALPYYLYTAWALFILMIGLLVTLSQRGEKR
jgi:hypothetical protein